MNPDLSKAQVHMDFQGIHGLRKVAREQSPEAIREVALQFEALFMQMMLKSMRDASMGDSLFDNDQSNMYRDMFDSQIALQLSKQRGLGLADMLERQLSGQSGLTNTRPEEKSYPLFNEGVRHPYAPKPVHPAPMPLPARTVLNPQVTVSPAQPAENAKFNSPEEFITALWPHAQRAGEELGVSPVAILAQSVLETGWGQYMIKHPDGKSSNNLFGIKADSRWDGNNVTIKTTEYKNGVASKERATFRAYDSIADSVDDYVSFIKANPRYQKALSQGNDPAAYIRGLQEAGYATDPRYARKILNIMQGDVMDNTLGITNTSQQDVTS